LKYFGFDILATDMWDAIANSQENKLTVSPFTIDIDERSALSADARVCECAVTQLFA
jgi:hypothetical protein